MTRKSRSSGGLFKSEYNMAKSKEYPTPRKVAFEQLLCEAIAKSKLVELRYECDVADRLFEPAAVYHSTQGKVCVTGMQVSNPGEPSASHQTRNFEVGKMTSLAVSTLETVTSREFNRLDERYRNGIICSV